MTSHRMVSAFIGVAMPLPGAAVAIVVRPSPLPPAPPSAQITRLPGQAATERVAVLSRDTFPTATDVVVINW